MARNRYQLPCTNVMLRLISALKAQLGGRGGIHTDELQPLLDEMCEVINLEDENMAW